MVQEGDAKPVQGASTAAPGRGSKLRALPMALAGLLLFAAGWFARDLRPNAEAQARPERPVAIVGNEAIYEKDFLQPIEAQVQKLRQQEYEVRRRALDDVINKKLLAAEAQRRGHAPQDHQPPNQHLDAHDSFLSLRLRIHSVYIFRRYIARVKSDSRIGEKEGGHGGAAQLPTRVRGTGLPGCDRRGGGHRHRVCDVRWVSV